MPLGMLCAFWNIHNMKDYECKICDPGITQFVLKNWNGVKGQTGGKNYIPMGISSFPFSK